MFVMRPLPVFELSFVESYKKFDSLVRPNNSLRRKEFKEFLFFTITEKLEYIPLKFSNKYNFKISNSKMDFNGNINSYFNLNNNEKKKYFFKEKIAFFNSYEKDVHHIIHQLKNNNNNYLHNVINDTIYHYKLNRRANQLLDVCVALVCFHWSSVFRWLILFIAASTMGSCNVASMRSLDAPRLLCSCRNSRALCSSEVVQPA